LTFPRWEYIGLVEQESPVMDEKGLIRWCSLAVTKRLAISATKFSIPVKADENRTQDNRLVTKH